MEELCSFRPTRNCVEENTGEREKLVMETLLLLRRENVWAAFPFFVVLVVQS